MSKVIERHLQSWSEYATTIEEITAFAAKERTKQSIGFSVPLYYRGLGDARWGLETSLERIGAHRISMHGYYLTTWLARPRIEAFTDRAWGIIGIDEYDEKLQSALFPQSPPEMEYLCYLRHHGFPSPLLDWTVSPFIAAFFAFENPPSGSERVVVYVYCYSARGNHVGADAAPTIHLVHSNIRTHRRHFLQQSRYTFCVVKSPYSWDYVSHDHVFLENSEYMVVETEGQDLLWKITLPTTERITALKALRGYNITKYSLVGSEEALLSTAALELLELNRPS